MKLAFFNYLPLEYGGGLAEYFVSISKGLKLRYPEISIQLVTFDERISNRILLLYSVFYFKKVRRDFPQVKHFELPRNIEYLKAHSVGHLGEILGNADLVYSKNDFVEAFILRYLVGYSHLGRVIFGFHSPIQYVRPHSIQGKMHNVIYNSRIYSMLISKSWAFHVINSFDLALLRGRFPLKRVKLIHNPFDFTSFSGVKLKESSQDRTFTLLWVGRLTKEKGTDLLISVIKALSKTSIFPKLRFIVVGSGTEEESILTLTKDFETVTFVGQVGKNKIRFYYRKSDAFLSTSRFETFPFTFLEAQSHGLPVLSFNVSGAREIIDQGRNGYIANSIEEIVGYITLLAKRKSRKKEISDYIRKKFDQDRIYKQFRNLLIHEGD